MEKFGDNAVSYSKYNFQKVYKAVQIGKQQCKMLKLLTQGKVSWKINEIVVPNNSVGREIS